MTDRPPQRVLVCRLGRVQYAATWALQREIQDRLIAAKRADPPVELPHVMLLVEHEPVFTLGKSGDETNLVWDQDRREREGVEFHHIDRGGDVTFHGPGQLVGYPILDLDRFFTDIHRYLRELEESVIATLADFDVSSGRVEGRTGVWVGPDNRGAERKICAMGVRCSRWVTMHGFALNVATDMRFYSGIVPCGIDDRGVTSLAEERGRPVALDELIPRFELNFGKQFAADLKVVSGQDAWDALSDFVNRTLEPVNYLSAAE